jgi:hypothetical protein
MTQTTVLLACILDFFDFLELLVVGAARKNQRSLKAVERAKMQSDDPPQRASIATCTTARLTKVGCEFRVWKCHAGGA